MTTEEWEELKNFSAEEKDIFGRELSKYTEGGINNAGHRVQPISYEMMTRLDGMVTHAKQIYGPETFCYIHDLNCGAHDNPDSYHYQGLASDWHLKGVSLYQMFMMAVYHEFSGIFYYPHWSKPGIHSDIRPGRMWGYKNSEGEYITVNDDFNEVTSEIKG